MKKLLVLLFLLIATTAQARYVSVDFDQSAGAEYYTFKWGTATGVYDYFYDIVTDDGTAAKYDSATAYSAGDRAYYWNNIWVANQSTTGNAPSSKSSYWDGPYYPYFTATGTSGPLPIEDETVYAVVTATNSSGEESSASDEIVFYYLEQDGSPTPEQISIFLQENITGWVDTSPDTPIYVTANRFTVVGDDRDVYAPGLKLRINDSGYVYSSVNRRVYSGGVTTVYLNSSVLTGGSISGIDRANWSPTATATMRYRKAGEVDWTTGHDLYHIDSNATDTGWAWMIFDLDEGSDYVVEVTVSDTGEDDVIYTKLMSTSSLPPAAGEPNIIIPAETSEGYIGATETTTYVNNIFDSADPGDVIEFENGTYHVDGLYYFSRNGTASQPIYIRGESRDGVILWDTDGAILHIKQSDYIIVENLTVSGSFTDWGCQGYNGVIGVWLETASDTGNTVRNINVLGTDQGIIAGNSASQLLIYENYLEGNNKWTQDLWGATDGCQGGPDGDPDIDGNQSSMWNDYGIQTKGNSNAVFNNTMKGYGDSIKISGNSSTNFNSFGYRNKITMSGDDVVEMDEAIRNVAWYDNYVSNAGTLASFQPIDHGPAIAFRNIGVNIARSNIFKMNGAGGGIFIYNNTLVRTANLNAGLKGNINHIWIQFNNGITQNWGFENNILIRQNDSGGYTLNHAASGNTVDATHNSWYPDGEFKWEHIDGPYASLALQKASTVEVTNIFGSGQRHYNDVIEDAQPFATAITLPEDTHTEVTTVYTPTLSATAESKNSGVVIAGITDGYTGVAPDRGAIISGRTVPTYGATYVYDD